MARFWRTSKRFAKRRRTSPERGPKIDDNARRALNKSPQQRRGSSKREPLGPCVSGELYEGLQRLWVPGRTPGANDIVASAKGFGGTGRAYYLLKDAWTRTIYREIAAAGLRPVSRCKVHFRFVEPSKRRDPDGLSWFSKFVLDALVTAGVLGDDGWDEIAGYSFSWETGTSPGVEVLLDSEVFEF